MKKLKYFIALYAAKATRLLLKLLGRDATYFPGKVAIYICKDFLAHIKTPKTVIAVTGTNGKTTVSNLLTSILTENGYSVTNNRLGSNIQAGVITALVEDTTLIGRPKKEIAVLEVDERSSLLVYSNLKPDYLICNNIMRDALKRNAHTEFIRFIINKELPESTKLILNADDLITSSLGTQGQQKVFFGLDAEKPEGSVPQQIRDMIYCPECGERLEYEYIRYDHIGRAICPKCGLRSPEPDYLVTDINRDENSFTVKHGSKEETFTLINDNIANIYNFCGVIAVLDQIGLTYEQIKKGFTDAKIVATRYEEIKAGDLNITMLLAKGQTSSACTRCYDYISKIPEKNKAAMIIVDDLNDNIGNSESTCWLYDCDYSALADESINQVVFIGPRCRDHYLRALMAGVSADKIKIIEDNAEAAKAVDTTASKHIFVLYEVFRLQDALAVKDILIDRGEKGE